MSKKDRNAASAPTNSVETTQHGTTGKESPATSWQKIVMVALLLYVLSLVWLVLSHHWYGVLPTWLDPH